MRTSESSLKFQGRLIILNLISKCVFRICLLLLISCLCITSLVYVLLCMTSGYMSSEINGVSCNTCLSVARNNGQYAPQIISKKKISPFISNGGVSMFSPSTLPKRSNDIVQISLQTDRWKVLSLSKRWVGGKIYEN